MRTLLYYPEVRLVVPGPAISFRLSGSTKYKKLVRSVAKEVFRKHGMFEKVEIRLDYFHTLPRRFDLDNVAKCVIDALSGIAYIDDKSVSHQSTRSHDLTKDIVLNDVPLDLIKPLSKYSNYLFLRIRCLDKTTNNKQKLGRSTKV